MKPLDEARAIADSGLEGCAHGHPGSPRQVLLMDIETLTELGLAPGIIKENITTQGLDLRSLRNGQRLRIGDAILEITLPCGPCKLMEDIRPGLQQQLRGRRGQLCRVIQSGLIRPGQCSGVDRSHGRRVDGAGVVPEDLCRGVSGRDHPGDHGRATSRGVRVRERDVRDRGTEAGRPRRRELWRRWARHDQRDRGPGAVAVRNRPSVSR